MALFWVKDSYILRPYKGPEVTMEPQLINENPSVFNAWISWFFSGIFETILASFSSPIPTAAKPAHLFRYSFDDLAERPGLNLFGLVVQEFSTSAVVVLGVGMMVCVYIDVEEMLNPFLSIEFMHVVYGAKSFVHRP